MSTLAPLTTPLKRLRLSGILDTLDVRTQQAIAEQWSYPEFLSRLVQDEVERRGQKQLDLRVRRHQYHQDAGDVRFRLQSQH
jgi:IstB-like ATP binding protein